MYHFIVSDKYENEVDAIQSFSAYFQRRYNFCPMFFPGSLQDACQVAFNSPDIKDVCSHLLL